MNEPARVALLDALRTRLLSTAELSECTGLPRPDVAAELREMESAGLVIRRNGGEATWSRSVLGVAELHQLLKARRR